MSQKDPKPPSRIDFEQFVRKHSTAKIIKSMRREPAPRQHVQISRNAIIQSDLAERPMSVMATFIDERDPAANPISPSTIAHTDPMEDETRSALETELLLARASRTTLFVECPYTPNTQRAYEGAWHAFSTWCERLQRVEPSLVALPASDDTLSLYIGALNHLTPSAVRQAVAAIRLTHERKGYPMLLEERPATVAALAGHARRRAAQKPSRQQRQQTAATDEQIRLMADACDTTTLIGLRDRALLLVGFDAALRRSQLVGINVEHLNFDAQDEGVTVWLPRSKSDLKGEEATVSLLVRPGSPWCPVEALRRWLAAANRSIGPVFVGFKRSGNCYQPGEQRLSDKAVARIVKATAKLAGCEGNFAGNSLRSGKSTTAL